MEHSKRHRLFVCVYGCGQLREKLWRLTEPSKSQQIPGKRNIKILSKRNISTHTIQNRMHKSSKQCNIATLKPKHMHTQGLNPLTTEWIYIKQYIDNENKKCKKKQKNKYIRVMGHRKAQRLPARGVGGCGGIDPKAILCYHA